jgi:hypothetical protein
LLSSEPATNLSKPFPDPAREFVKLFAKMSVGNMSSTILQIYQTLAVEFQREQNKSISQTEDLLPTLHHFLLLVLVMIYLLLFFYLLFLPLFDPRET